jgi:ankyrin repeat protein
MTQKELNKALTWASENGHTEIVKLLKDATLRRIVDEKIYTAN